jgi:hypothetical protein
MWSLRWKRRIIEMHRGMLEYLRLPSMCGMLWVKWTYGMYSLEKVGDFRDVDIAC